MALGEAPHDLYFQTSLKSLRKTIEIICFRTLRILFDFKMHKTLKKNESETDFCLKDFMRFKIQ